MDNEYVTSLIYNLFSGGNIYKKQGQFEESRGGVSSEGSGFE